LRDDLAALGGDGLDRAGHEHDIRKAIDVARVLGRIRSSATMARGAERIDKFVGLGLHAERFSVHEQLHLWSQWLAATYNRLFVSAG